MQEDRWQSDKLTGQAITTFLSIKLGIVMPVPSIYRAYRHDHSYEFLWMVSGIPEQLQDPAYTINQLSLSNTESRAGFGLLAALDLPEILSSLEGTVRSSCSDYSIFRASLEYLLDPSFCY